ncbi:MAG: hypothetical protein EP329_25795 [Deltaproteobacteria bacterium]|nr:MAG: hypothetical protein EP329_25795 [Deltaproteobacteria bacterium]
MAFDLRDCTFFGPALPEPFVKFQLEAELTKRKLLPKTTGDEGRALQDRWDVYRRKLRALGEQGGDRRVASHVLEPLAERLGYAAFESQAEVITREGPEDGGWLFTSEDGRKLRAWSVGLGTDLDAPSRRGRAYRFSPSRVAQRVLLASGERVGLLTDGEELRLLLCDPARPDSHIAVRLDRSGGWRAARGVPDSYRLLLALASPDGVAVVPDLAEAARLAQSTVTKKLRLQARRAIEGFLQELLDHPDNAAVRAEWTDAGELARALWREGLILVYRLLFVFKLESSADPARAFSFAATSLWRNTYSPNTALARLVRRVLDDGADSGGFLESGLRALWRMFANGMSSSELEIRPLGGMLFGRDATPLLDRLTWGERGVARLLDALLWTPGDGRTERERVHYGALDVEDLGRVYEALLELEPGITTEAMCRLRRAKLEVVVPVSQGLPYRTDLAPTDLDDDEDSDTDDADDGEEDEAPKRRGKAAAGSKTKVQFIEEIPAGRFFLRVGLGRKASGSYYTPHPFVRFLVQETLEPQLAERSPKEDPHPGRILELKVLDPAMGSGHFLVEACRYLGEALYEACRLCDELAVQAEEQAAKVAEAEHEALLAHAAELRKRVEDLPDPEDELVAYLPSRAAEGEESGLSQRKAEALCRRLVAVHCLYGVDKNPLAVELAKLSLWLESYAEGLPLTFMDHRLIQGDSLTGPFFEHLLAYPKSGEKLDDLFAQGLTELLDATLTAALVHVRDLDASVGKDVADLERKRTAKEKLDAMLAPLKTLAAAWSGGVMLGDECDDAGYQALAQAVARGEDAGRALAPRPRLLRMVETGRASLAFQLAFPEVFLDGRPGRSGFDAVLGNPPWDKLRIERRDFLAAIDPAYMEGKESAGVGSEHHVLEEVFDTHPLAREYAKVVEQEKRGALGVVSAETRAQEVAAATSDPDLYRLFMLRSSAVLSPTGGRLGFVVGGGLAKVPADRPLRIWLFEALAVQWFVHYLNLRQLFGGASSRVSFVCLVGARGGKRVSVHMGMECQRFEDLLAGGGVSSFEPSAVAFALSDDGDLTKVFHRANTGFELASRLDALQGICDLGVKAAADIHRTNDKDALRRLRDIVPGADDARRPDVIGVLLTLGAAPLYGGKSMRDYDPLPTEKSGKWEPAVAEVALLDHVRIARLYGALCHYRFAWRATCGLVATNERSARAVLLPPGAVAGDSLRVEHEPSNRPTANVCVALACFNSFAFDFAARRVVQANLNLGVLRTLPWPDLAAMAGSFAARAAVRLSAVNTLYAPLWTEQFGDAWREPTPKHTWPVLEGDDARWAVRAAIDAVVADAYGLDRAQYEHVLSTFSHKSYPKAPELCLSAFDELKAIGLEAFTKKHDPYWDIPLNECLPKPVIDLPVAGADAPTNQSLGPLFAGLGPAPEKPAAAPRPTPRPAPPSDDGAYDTIARLLEARGLITSGDAQRATGLDAAGVRPHLKRLVDEGRAVTEGQGRGTKYRRSDG